MTSAVYEASYNIHAIKTHDNGVRESRLWGRPPGRKAKHDLVYDLPGHSNYGKSRDAGTARFPLRIVDGDGRFFAIHGETCYDSTDLATLRKHMEAIALAEHEVTWERYIELSYTASVRNGEGSRTRGGVDELALHEKRGKRVVVTGLRLSWKVLEYSSEFTPPGGVASRKRRHVDDKGHPSDDLKIVEDDLPEGLIPHSVARVVFLRSMQAALTDLDARIVALFAGSPEKIAERLDNAVPGLLALPAPTAEQPGRKRRA